MRFGVLRQVFVDGDFGEIRAENVGAGLQYNGDQRQRDLPAIGLQISQQAPHQPASYALPNISSSWMAAMNCEYFSGAYI